MSVVIRLGGEDAQSVREEVVGAIEDLIDAGVRNFSWTVEDEEPAFTPGSELVDGVPREWLEEFAAHLETTSMELAGIRVEESAVAFERSENIRKFLRKRGS